MKFASKVFVRMACVWSVLAIAAVAACSASPKTECVKKDYPDLACGTIQTCATGSGDSCTGVYQLLPNGQKFNCASCKECEKAQLEAVTACGVKGGTPPSGVEPDAGDPQSGDPDAGG